MATSDASEATPGSAEPARTAPRRVLAGLVLALLAVLLVAVAARPAGFGRFVLGFAYRGPLVDAERWEVWANANRDLFGPLHTGARVALVEHVDDSTGVVLERTGDGLRAERTHFLWLDRPPVALAMPPRIAAELQAVSIETHGDLFWDALKLHTREGRIRCWSFADRDELERSGLAAFLRNVDVHAPAPPPGSEGG